MPRTASATAPRKAAPTPRAFYWLGEVASQLCIARSTVVTLADRGDLPKPFRIGNRIAFDRVKVDAAIKKMGVPLSA